MGGQHAKPKKVANENGERNIGPKPVKGKMNVSFVYQGIYMMFAFLYN